MSCVEDGAAGSFVDTAGFHAHEAIFDDIHAADAVFATKFVHCLEQREGIETTAIDAGGDTAFEADLDVLGFIGGFERIHGKLKHVRGRLAPRVFEDATLVTDVEGVAIGAVGLGFGGRDRDAMLLGIRDHFGTRVEGPLGVSPGCDDFDIGLEGVIGEFEADLIVAFAGGAVGDISGLFFARDFDLALGNEGTGDTCAKHVLTFVVSIPFDEPPHVVFDEFTSEVFNVDFDGTGFQRLCADIGEFFALAEVSGIRNNVIAALDEPFEDDRSIEAARVRKDYAFTLTHVVIPWLTRLMFASVPCAVDTENTRRRDNETSESLVHKLCVRDPIIRGAGSEGEWHERERRGEQHVRCWQWGTEGT